MHPGWWRFNSLFSGGSSRIRTLDSLSSFRYPLYHYRGAAVHHSPQLQTILVVSLSLPAGVTVARMTLDHSVHVRIVGGELRHNSLPFRELRKPVCE
jgi:hypothetical protein